MVLVELLILIAGNSIELDLLFDVVDLLVVVLEESKPGVVLLCDSFGSLTLANCLTNSFRFLDLLLLVVYCPNSTY